MTWRGQVLKRGFDILAAGVGLALLWPVIFAGWSLAARDTGASGFFRQERIGRHGRPFCIIKLRTMRPGSGSTVTTRDDPRVTPLGRRLRKWKIDELPQLGNVLMGDMSFVGPRPDVPALADKLKGEQREILQLRPGITGPATLKYRNEEDILAQAEDPEQYNADVIWPDKVSINIDYLRNWSFGRDLRYILETVLR